MSESAKEYVPWWKQVGQSIPGIQRLSVRGTRIVLLMVFFASLAIAATQMLVPGWIWGRLQPVLPQSLTKNVNSFWLPVVLHGNLYRARFNREIYAVSVSKDGTVWIGGEQGLLAFSKDRGESWTCLTFEAKTGGFNNTHDCGAGSTSSGVVAANAGGPWPLIEPKVYAAQVNGAVPSTSKVSQGSVQSAALKDSQPLALSDISYNFGVVALNTSATWTLKVVGTPLTKPQNLIAAMTASSNAAPTFRVLGASECELIGPSSGCSFSIEFLPQKVGPYQTSLMLRSVDISSATSTSTAPSREYVISLTGFGQDTAAATTQPSSFPAQDASSTKAGTTSKTPSPTPGPTNSPGDIIYVDGVHLVMANGNQPQVLVQLMAFGGAQGEWVRPWSESYSRELEGGKPFAGLASKGADPNYYLSQQKGCPDVTAGRSFRAMLNQMLVKMPSIMEDCSSIKTDAGTHLNAFASAQSFNSPAATALWTDYAVGGRPGRGMIFRIENGSSPRRIITPLTRDAAAESMLLPIGMKLPPPWLYVVGLLCCVILYAVLQGRRPEPKQGIEGMAVNDRPLESRDADAVRLRTVADGMSRFFRNPSTRAPLVLCINGNWGSGKSSLMNLVADDLKHHQHTVIPFNAWHHQSEEQILASLLQTVRINALRSPWTITGAVTRLRIFLKRWPERWFVSVVFCLATVWTALLAHDFLNTGTVDLSKVAAFIPAFVTTLVTLRTIAQGFTGFLSNPASLLAGNARGSKDELEEQTTLRERFARDFGTVTQVLGNGKLVLLIDDLDRCSPEKIRDIVEAINFLVTAGECYIVLGMARKVVEYYLGNSFTDAIKTMPASLLGLTEDEVKIVGKRESAFANLYLQKMIQLQFNLLPLTDAQAITLLRSGNQHDGLELTPSKQDYTLDTRSLLKWESRIRWIQGMVQRWFLPVTGTLLLTLAAVYTLQNSANWLEQHLARYLVKPAGNISSPGTTAAAPQQATISTSDLPKLTAGSAAADKANDLPAIKATALLPDDKNLSVDGDIDPKHTQAPAITFPVHGENESLLVPDVQLSRTSPGVIQALLLVMVLGGGMWMLAQWWLITRPDAENAKDSEPFLGALGDWAPALLAIYKTPRGLKQYLNSVRFLAMLQRSQIEPAKGTERQSFVRRAALWIVAGRNDDTKEGILQKLQEQARAGFLLDPVIPDELLVTLAALHATPAIAAQAAAWFNCAAEFGVSSDSATNTINEASNSADGEGASMIDQASKSPADKAQNTKIEEALYSKINEALRATAKRTVTAPDSTQDQLRASLATYRAAFCRLNGQTE